MLKAVLGGGSVMHVVHFRMCMSICTSVWGSGGIGVSIRGALSNKITRHIHAEGVDTDRNLQNGFLLRLFIFVHLMVQFAISIS